MRLVPHGRVLAPDLRGHGDSDWIGAGGYYHFFDYLADIDELVTRAIGTRTPIVLVGHSMGGSIAGYWAGMRPGARPRARADRGPRATRRGRCDDPGPHRGVDRSVARCARSRARDGLGRRRRAPAAPPRRQAGRGDRARRWLALHGTRAVDGGVTWKHDPLHATMGPYPYRLDVAMQFWRRVTCPVLCIDGAESRLNLADDERTRRRAVFASCRHAVIAGAGHAVPRHAPAEVARLIAEHCREAPADPAAGCLATVISSSRASSRSSPRRRGSRPSAACPSCGERSASRRA